MHPGEQKAKDAAAKVRGALDEDGFSPSTGDTSGTAVASLDVGATMVVFYGNGNDAAADYRSIKKVFAKHPDRGLVQIQDDRVYFLGKEHALSADDRAEFDRIVSTAEAAL